MRSPTITLALIATVPLATACRRQVAPPEPPPAERVESPALGLAILALPEGFAVAANQGETLVLSRTAEGDAARLYVDLGPLQPGGVDLIAWVESQPAEYERHPDGRFNGSRKLRTPIGDAFTARGRYRGEAGEMEETRVLAVHPAAPRLLLVRYIYPAGDDTTARIQQLLDVFAEIEPIAF